MALIHCPECGKEVSDQTPACIHCGYPLRDHQNLQEEKQGPQETPYPPEETIPNSQEHI